MDPSAIRHSLEEILASRAFAQSKRMCRFLRFTVEEALAGRGCSLKEAVIGPAVFDRPADFDPRTDPIVRVEARRLRSKLARYYQDKPDAGPVCIEFPVGSYAPQFRARSVPTPQKAAVTTLAVLPFENLNPGQNEEFFAAGLTQELIHRLTRLPGLRVMAWDSSVRLRNQPTAPSPVAAWLEGTVRRSGARVRIAVQLVDPVTRVYLWTASFDRHIRDLLAVQDELATAMANALEIQLVKDEEAKTVDAKAYPLYLRGRNALAGRTEEGMRQAIFCFEQAIERDPGNASVYAGLATAFVLLCDYGFDRGERYYDQARASAARALEIDPHSAEAHNALAGVCAKFDWDWRAAEEHYTRSIEINPGFATARHWFSVDCLALLGRMEEARTQIVTARELSPLDPIMHSSEGYFEYLARNPSGAEAAYRESLRLRPDHARTWAGLGRVFAFRGDYAGALELLGRARTLSADDTSVISAMGQIHGMAGDAAGALGCMQMLEDWARHRHVAQIRFAVVAEGLGDIDRALTHLESALAAREPQVTGLNVHPAFDSLRENPRFKALIARTGVKE